MKSISASIVILAASGLILGGAFVRHGDSRLFVPAVGVLLGLAGLWGWAASLKSSPSE